MKVTAAHTDPSASPRLSLSVRSFLDFITLNLNSTKSFYLRDIDATNLPAPQNRNTNHPEGNSRPNSCLAFISAESLGQCDNTRIGR